VIMESTRTVDSAKSPKSIPQGFRIDRDIGHIELGVVDYGTLTVVSAGARFYEWINRPLRRRVSLLEVIPGIDLASVHKALDKFDGECELEGCFTSATGMSVNLRIRLMQTGSGPTSPLRLLAFDVSELRKKEEILRTVASLLESHKALIADSRKTLKVLLDSLPQAVFLVDSALCVTSEISKKAEELFGSDLAQASLADLLRCSEDDLEPLRMAFSGMPWDLMSGILPNEFQLDSREYSIAFIPVMDQENLASVTVVVTDISDRREMERSLERTDADNRSLVAILASKEEFLDLVNLCNKAESYIDDLNGFRSMIHGLKGGFSFLECDRLANICHQSEDGLSSELYTPDSGRALVAELKEELQSFINRYQHVLQVEGRSGAEIAARRISLDYDSVGRIYQEAFRVGAPAELLVSIESLVEAPVQRILGWLDKVWIKTLEGESKEGMSIAWSGDVKLAREPYKELFQSFVHIIRNSADHGIERPGDRELSGKPRAGSMHIDLSFKDGVYLFTFEDDGAGIDPEKLVAIARSRGLSVPEGLTREEALMLICEPGFSSCSKVTSLSGRGIGVDAVRRLARLFGGDVSVASDLGKSTKISVWFRRQRYWGA
jgi:two-component system chemotaxis sensor kinase CheA